MSQNPTASDWLTTRGEKWHQHLSGMEATLAPIDEPLLQALALDGPLRIAEVGSGGGATAAAILRRAPVGSIVHGFDLAPLLVDEARRRHALAGLTFATADMGTASPDAPYDRVVSRLGIMFFDAPELAFANLSRWLKPDGRFAFAVWAPPRENPWLSIAREAVATVVEVPSPDPNGPGPYRYADPSVLVSLLERTGFAGISVNTWRGLLPIGGAMDAADAARFALASFSSFSELLAPGGVPAFDQALRVLTPKLEAHAHDGVVRLGAALHIVSGHVRS